MTPETEEPQNPVPYPHRLLAVAVAYLVAIVGIHVLKNAWITLIGYHVVLALWMRPYFMEIFDKVKLGRMTAWGWLLCILCSLAGVVLYSILYFSSLGGVTTKLHTYGLSGFSWTLFFLYFSIVNPILEEMFWRGYQHDEGWKAILNHFLFAGYHLIFLPLFLPMPLTLGCILCLTVAAWLFRRSALHSGGLLVPSVAHALADISILLAAIRL